MKTIKFSNENLSALIIFLAALGFRLIDLGRVPLSDHEARLALTALSLAKGTGASMLSQPGYISLTSLLFFLFGSSDFLARLIPVVSGSLLALSTIFYRKQLGTRTSLVLAVLFAIDPGLLALSRTADGTTMVLVLTLMAAGMLFNGRMILGGVCAGLALLGGPLLWPGAITGGLAVWLSRGAFTGDGQVVSTDQEQDENKSYFQKLFSGNWTGFWLALGLTAGIVATQFILHPQGLNAIANGLVDYFKSWSSGFTAPTIQSLLLFFLYEPFFLLLAFFRGIKAWFTGNEFDKFLMCWMLLAILVSFINPGQVFSSAAWVLIPMLALSARQIDGIFAKKLDLTPQAGAQAFVTFALTIFIVFTLVGLSNGLSSPEDTRLQIIAVAGSFAILALTTYLLGSGWGWGNTAAGIRIAVFGLLALSVFSAGWHAAGLGRQPDREMWRIGRTVISGDLLKTTLGDISEYNTGRRDTLDVTVAGMESAALDWELRDFKKVTFITYVVSDEKASILLTPAEKLPPLGERYRGQKIVWTSQPAWEIMNPEEWPAWLFFRKATLDTSSIIIWVRSDLFPGSASGDIPVN
ncbi:MAG: hypothetical protein AB9891_17300 [Anaerolineaceae bacterium]